NENGVRDAGELGLSGWTVYQDQNNNGVFDSTLGATVSSTDVPKTIPDEGTVISTLNVSGAGRSLTDVNVRLNITHFYDADLIVSLIGPGGQQVQLFKDVGGAGHDFDNTVLDDEATIPIGNSTAPFSGSFKPQGLLSAFDGTDPTGAGAG